MKLSRYTLIIDESPDNCLALCTLTKAIIRLNSKTKQDLITADASSLQELTGEEFE